MPLYLGEEDRGREGAAHHVALQLGHVDAVGGEAAEALVERRRHVAALEHEGGDDRPGVGAGVERVAREHHEACRVVGLVLDVRFDDLEPVGLRREQGGDRCTGGIARRSHLGGGACGVGAHDREQPEPADKLAALGERVHVRMHGFEPRRRRPGAREQVVADALEVLGNHVQIRLGQKLVNVGHAARRRVLDRDHRERRAAVRDCGEGVAEGLARQRGHRRVAGGAGGLGICAGRALERDHRGRIVRTSAAIGRDVGWRHETKACRLRAAATGAPMTGARISVPGASVSTRAMSSLLPRGPSVAISCRRGYRIAWLPLSRRRAVGCRTLCQERRRCGASEGVIGDMP